MPFYRNRIQDGKFDSFEEYRFFFESFSYYADETDKFIRKEINSEKSRFELYKKAAENDPEEIREDFMFELELKTREGMVDIYFDSLIVTLYSFIEKKMLQLCRYFQAKQVFNVNEIKGDGIVKYKLYLERAGRMDFSQVKEDWDKLIHFKKLRNIIVHSDGVRVIPSQESGLIKFLKEQPGVALADSPDGTGILFHFEDAQLVFTFHRCAGVIVDFLFDEEVTF